MRKHLRERNYTGMGVPAGDKKPDETAKGKPQAKPAAKRVETVTAKPPEARNVTPKAKPVANPAPKPLKGVGGVVAEATDSSRPRDKNTPIHHGSFD